MIEVYHIEDDKAIAHAVKEYLEQHDCRVSVFTTMEEARQAWYAVPAIVLVDWNMPDGQGDSAVQVDPFKMEGASGHFPYGTR